MQRLQRADQRLGLVACALLQPLRLLPRGRARDVERVLLVKFWGIGSLQLLTPAVQSLRRRHPNARLELLTLRQNGEFVRGLGVFDEVLELDVDSSGWLRLFGRITRALWRLRRRGYGAVYDFEFFTRFSAIVTAVVGAPLRVGFESPRIWRGRFHTATVPFNRYWHVARNFRCLAGGENGRAVEPEDLTPLTVSDTTRERLDALLSEEGLGGAGPLIVLNPNAGALSLERRWPTANFADLARRLARELPGARVALIGSRGERDYTGEILAQAGEGLGAAANLAGRLDVAELGALLERADLFVGNDSGPMHLAAALGTPTVGLFGPETPVMYEPIGTRTRALYRPPACSPCINVHDNKLSACWRGRPECLLNLGVDLVEAAALNLIRDDGVRSGRVEVEA
ncbi:ADP-heptose--LPS heptosyltransferase 2 [Planctomycetes bacterium Pla163]|uniref:ADP-heptose--LPS heptosyltransferase 2 n=1 Tax=Rohdeia mirabilis TaxID=2528008 RepID=A0A518CUT5_9BACT|nr:ADP-heptose--LPS heptosyltransferase 2 [Planctomycetes bacterium Pla163]